MSELAEEKKKNRALLFVLIGVGAILVAAIVVLLIFLLGANPGNPNALPANSESASPTPTESDSPTPSATPTPSTVPTPTPTAAPPPPPPPPSGPGFTVFAPDTTVTCDKGTENFSPPPPVVQVRWETRLAAEVWFIMGTDDAVNSGFMQVPTAGDERDFPYEINFPCNQTSQKFTMTILGTNGQHINKTWTVKNNGDVF